MIINREGELYGMSKAKTEYLQCCNCGHIHQEKILCRDDDLYVLTNCDCCKEIVNHLRCGENQEDIYKYYDCTKDFRFYNYKTK